MDRRHFIAFSGLAAIGTHRAWAQHAGHGTQLPEAASSPDPYSRLQGGVPHHLTPSRKRSASPTARRRPARRGAGSPALPLPDPAQRDGLGTALDGRMHIVGGYGEGRVDRAYHHVYDPAVDRWFNAAPLPRGANHVAVAADAGRVYALGGFIEQNRNPDHNAYVYDVAADRWTRHRPAAPSARRRRRRGARTAGST